MKKYFYKYKSILSCVLAYIFALTCLVGYETQIVRAEENRISWTSLYLWESRQNLDNATIFNDSDTTETNRIGFCEFTTYYKSQCLAEASNINVEEGKRYRASVDVDTSQNKTVIIQVITGYSNIIAENYESINGKKTLSVDFTADASVVKISLMFGAVNDQEVGRYKYVILENLRLEEVTTQEGTETSIVHTIDEQRSKIPIYKLVIKGKKEVKAGKKISLKYVITPSNATNKKIQWSISNKKYASVSEKGLFTAKKTGKGRTVTVICKALDGSGKKATIKIKIIK